MATPKDHRSKAEELLALGRTYPHNSAARLATFTEAQVEALLALAALQGPSVLRIPESMELAPEEIAALADSRLIVTTDPAVTLGTADDHGTPPVPEVDEALKAPAKARRTRKAAPAKEAEA